MYMYILHKHLKRYIWINADEEDKMKDKIDAKKL